MRRSITYTRTSLLVGLLIVIFSGCGTEESAPAEKASIVEDTGKQRIRSFWDNYREATRFRQQGEFEAARTAYKKALLDNEEHEDALYYLGNVSMELEAWEDAEASWRKLLEADSTNLRAYSQLGHLFLCRPEISLFDVNRAREAFEQVHRSNPEETGPVLRLGETALIEGRFDRAAGYLDDVLGTDDVNLEAIFLKAYLEWRSGSGSKGLSRLNNVLTAVEPEASPGEGDTRTGTGPALARSAGCPLFDPFVESLEDSSGPIGPSQAEAYFERLDRLLSGLRPPVRR